MSIAAIELDGSGAPVPREGSKPTPQPKTGKYGVYDASAYYPRSYSGGMAAASALFAALSAIEAELRSDRARLGSTGKADVAVWFGQNGKWTWIASAPHPFAIPYVEERAGCSRCGSQDHLKCYRPLGSFEPDPPRRAEPTVAAQVSQEPAIGIPYAPAREYISPQEQELFDRVGREAPWLVEAARPGAASLVEAYRTAVKAFKDMEASQNATDR